MSSPSRCPPAGSQELAELARRVAASIAGLRFTFDGEVVSVTASIGITLGPRHENDSERLIDALDRAMYLASKAMGGIAGSFQRDAGGAGTDRLRRQARIPPCSVAALVRLPTPEVIHA